MSLTRARELREQRATLWEQAKDLHERASDEGRDLSDDEKQTWDRLTERMDELETEFRDIEAREERIRKVGEELAEKQEALTARKEFGAEQESAEEQNELHKRAFRNYIVRGWFGLDAEDKEILSETRALATQVVGTNAQGGYTVPTDFRAQLVEAMKAFGGVRSVANVITTDNGRNLQVPVSDDTGNVATIIGEATAITASTHVPFGQKTLEAAKYYSGPIKLSSELLQDSALDMEMIVRDKMVMRFARATEAHYATRSSTESSGPHGIVNDSTGAVTIDDGTGGSGLNKLTFEKLLDLEDSIDPAYRRNARWMFADQTRAYLRKIRENSTSSDGQFLWQPSLQAGTPDRLLGYPVVLNQDMQAWGTTGNKPVFFGDFSHYWIRDVRPIAVRRLEERYAEEDVVALVAYMRTDGRSVFGSTDPALKPYRCILEVST